MCLLISVLSMCKNKLIRIKDSTVHMLKFLLACYFKYVFVIHYSLGFYFLLAFVCKICD